MKLGTLLVSGRKFRLPCVYEFLRNDVVLYVGRSDAGFSRAFHAYGKAAYGPRACEGRRGEAFNQANQIRVTVFDNTTEAKFEELRLIRLHQPKYNTYGK